MAEDDIQPDDDADAGDGTGADSKKPKKTPGKKLVLRFVLPAVVLAAIGAGAYFGGVVDMVTGGDEKAAGADGVAVDAEPKEPENLVYYDLPEMLVNLSSDGRRTHFLKIKVSLELTQQSDVERIEAILPRIIDNFQVYLRELRIEDMQGSAGLYRLREELLTRVTLAAAPAEVSDVLFREMIVQ